MKQESLNKVLINKMGSDFSQRFLCRIVGFCCCHLGQVVNLQPQC